jgi:hypothetical protein
MIMSFVTYSLIRHDSKFYFNANNSRLFNVQIQGNPYIQACLDADRETMEIYFSTDNQFMVITYGNGKPDAYCRDSNDKEYRSNSILTKAKTILAIFSTYLTRDISLSETIVAMTKIFNEVESIVPTFEELNR